MATSLESKATDLAADIGKLGATALRIKEERDMLAESLREMVDEWLSADKGTALGMERYIKARAALAQVQS